MHPVTDHRDRRSEPVGHGHCDRPTEDAVRDAGLVGAPMVYGLLPLRRRRLLPLAIRRNHRQLIEEKEKIKGIKKKEKKRPE